MTGPLLQLRHVTKTFGSLVANDNVDLDVLPGRVHALVGENGAGKTTLMSMINGTGVPDSGTIMYDGTEVSITTPQQAAALGIGELQRVEVLKALSHETRLLVLDEPTAVLTPSETDDMFVVIRELAMSGVAVIFISHKLDEVLAIADVVTVKGTDITRASIAARRAAGMAYIPDDRHHVGTAPRMSVADNVGATHLSPPVARTSWLSMSGLSQFASRLIRTYDIRGAVPTTPVGSLSGGNMQKVVIAREFESDPALLVVSQP